MRKFIVQFYNQNANRWEDYRNCDNKDEAKYHQKVLKRDGVGKVRIWKIREGGEGSDKRTI